MIAQRLAAFAVAPVAGKAALAMMRLSLADWLACGLAGRAEPVAEIVRGMALAEGGKGQATLFAGGSAPMRAAALVNGTISHALDYDDTHFAHIGHPSVAVIPAALAVAEKRGSSGEAFLAACLIGAEVSIRVGEWLGRAHYQTGFHQTATAGSFGATAAAGRLLGLDAGQLAQAFGLVSTRASGLKSQFGTMGKPFNAGIAASNGVEAALLTARDFVSSPLAVDGAQGFGPTHHGEGNVEAFESLGQDWRFEYVSHKFHACCHGLHAMLEAVGTLADRVDPGLLDEIVIATHPRWMSVCNILEPATGLEAKFSYRLTAAMRLLGIETAGMDNYSDALCVDTAVVGIRNKVRVEADETLPETAARVVLWEGGETLVATHDLTTPDSLKERAEKLKTKSESLLGNPQSGRIWRAVEALDIAAITNEMGRE